MDSVSIAFISSSIRHAFRSRSQHGKAKTTINTAGDDGLLPVQRWRYRYQALGHSAYLRRAPNAIVTWQKAATWMMTYLCSPASGICEFDPYKELIVIHFTRTLRGQRVQPPDPLTCNSCFLPSKMRRKTHLTLWHFQCLSDLTAVTPRVSLLLPAVDCMYNKMYIDLRKLTLFCNFKLHFTREGNRSWQKKSSFHTWLTGRDNATRHRLFHAVFLTSLIRLSPGFPLKTPHEHTPWFQLAG